MARGGRQGWATGAAAFWGAATLAATLCGEVGAHVPGGLAAVEGTWSAPLEVLGDRRSLLSSFKAKKKMKKKQKNRKFGRGSPSLGVDSVSDVAGDYALPPDEDFNSIYDVTGDYVLPPDEDFNSIDDVTGDYVAPQPRDFEGFSSKSDASFAGTAGEIFDRVLQYAASTDKEFDDDGFLACLREILKRQENDEGFEWDYTC